MKNVRFIAPLLALIVFVCFYSVHQKGQKERNAIEVARVASDLKAKNDAELLARKTAMADAIKAFRDQDRLTKQLERLKKDIELEEAASTKLTAARKESEAERQFLIELNAKAQTNVKTLQTVLTNLAIPAPAPVAAK